MCQLLWFLKELIKSLILVFLVLVIQSSINQDLLCSHWLNGGSLVVWNHQWIITQLCRCMSFTASFCSLFRLRCTYTVWLSHSALTDPIIQQQQPFSHQKILLNQMCATCPAPTAARHISHYRWMLKSIRNTVILSSHWSLFSAQLMSINPVFTLHFAMLWPPAPEKQSWSFAVKDQFFQKCQFSRSLLTPMWMESQGRLQNISGASRQDSTGSFSWTTEIDRDLL